MRDYFGALQTAVTSLTNANWNYFAVESVQCIKYHSCLLQLAQALTRSSYHKTIKDGNAQGDYLIIDNIKEGLNGK